MKRCLWLLLLCACGDLPAPERPDPSEFIPPETDNNNNREGLSAGVPPAQPILTNVPERTGSLTLAVRGQTDPLSAVVVINGALSAFAESGSGGGFCVDVALRAGETQTLEVSAQNNEGLVSPVTTFTVTHDPTLTEEPIEEEPEDRVLQPAVSPDTTLVYLSRRPNSGSLLDVADDDLATVLVTEPAELTLDLQSVMDVAAIEIEFRDEVGRGSDQYAAKYTVRVSAQDSASPPSAWTELPDTALLGTRDGGIDRFALETVTNVRWVSFDLIENAVNDFFGEPIAVADVRVDALAGGGSGLPGPASPTCLP
ncbi:MAG: discoidin domain-containing protein [Myxococcota bacterium]